MSGAYTIEHVINDIVSERTRSEMKTGKNPRGVAFYVESWEALNSWIESRLRKRQGASVSPLGEFTWETKMIEGLASCRPIFLVGDSFVKDHHIRQKRFYKPTSLAKSEEVNYSKLAIKFSKSLTKDMVFSGVRDILKKIGDYIDRIYEIEIAFSFGVLYSKERRLKFEFDNARLMQILPESMVESLSNKSMGYNQSSGFMTERSDDLTVGTSSRRPPPLTLTGSAPFNVTYQSSRQEMDESSRPQTERVGNATMQHAESMQQPSPHCKPATAESAPVPALQLNMTYKDLDRTKPAPPLSPGLRDLLMSMDEKQLSRAAKVERRIQACDSVAKMAFGRCLFEVESSAVDDDYTNHQSRLLQEQWQEKQRLKREVQKKEMSDIQDTLKEQMEAIQRRRDAEVYDRKHGVMGAALPGLSDSKNLISEEALRKQKKQMLRALQKQIIVAKQEAMQKKEDTLREESKQLEIIRNDIDMERLVTRAAALEKQRDLLEAWEREAHIRNLKKLKEQGADAVKTYMQETAVLSEAESARAGRGMGGFTLRSSRSGVGFDARKHK